MVADSTHLPPSLSEVRMLRQTLRTWLVETPVIRCRNLEDRLDKGVEIWGKMEFLQQTGTFKPRGALANLLRLDEAGLRAGVTAVSAGNHAIATAFAAQSIGTSAKVVMLRTASPVRIDGCRRYGAEVVLADDVHQAFDLADRIRDAEGRTLIHPFEGSGVTAGTGTLGLEICEQIREFDVVIVPIGGGGLCSGVASTVKRLSPHCKVIGVEPVGADSMSRSFASARAEELDRVDTIADSLGAPFALPYSFSICRQFVDEIVVVSDDQLRQAMGILFGDMKIAVEPACAASTAALISLGDGLEGKKVVLLFCGSNIDWLTYQEHARFSDAH